MHGVVAFEKKVEHRAMRPVRSVPAGARSGVVVMAVRTADQRSLGDRRIQAHRVRGGGGLHDRVKAWIGRAKLEAQVRLIRAKLDLNIAVASLHNSMGVSR